MPVSLISETISLYSEVFVDAIATSASGELSATLTKTLLVKAESLFEAIPVNTASLKLSLPEEDIILAIAPESFADAPVIAVVNTFPTRFPSC